jgi:hypothetical protein
MSLDDIAANDRRVAALNRTGHLEPRLDRSHVGRSDDLDRKAMALDVLDPLGAASAAWRFVDGHGRRVGRGSQREGRKGDHAEQCLALFHHLILS